MTPRRPNVRPSDYALAWVALAVAAVAMLLDRHCGAGYVGADVWSGIVSALSMVVDFLSLIGDAVVVSLEAVVGWLVDGVGWLSGRVAQMLVSTGAVFAKVWEGLRVIWSDVLQPAFEWIGGQVKRFYTWLHDTLAPVFEFLGKVQKFLQGIYKDYIRPILDALDIAHGILRLLGDLGIEWAKKLDVWVLKVEQTIDENWVKLTGWINELRDTLYAVVTPGRLFQRLPFLTTLNRDLLYCGRMFTNARMRGLTDEQQARRAAAAKPQVTRQLVDDLNAYLSGETNDSGDVIDAAVSRARDLLESA